MKIFNKIKSILFDDFAYIINIEFKNIKSNYFNNIISKSKAYYIENGVYDNGKIVSASILKIVINEIDLKILKLNNLEEARKCPSPATIFSAFYEGKFLTNDMSICLEKNFKKIVLGEK